MPILWFMNYGIRDYKKFTNIYGSFLFLKRKKIYDESLIFTSDDSNVTGQYLAEISLFITKIKRHFKNVLLDGDNKNIKNYLKNNVKSLKSSKIVTVGIDGNFDIEWNFEEEIPKKIKNKKFDLIISQSNLEHLLNPYLHFQELVKLLTKNGFFVLATHLPGYPYHRWPIDTIRFMPDWFEEAAKRNGLKIVRKYLRIEMIVVYIFQKI